MSEAASRQCRELTPQVKEMKKVTQTLFAGVVFLPIAAFAADPVIPWADNSGGTESQHIAAVGQDLNAQHEAVTQTQEGVWADNSGSIKADEQALGTPQPAAANTAK
jgi:hypothetical protein